MFLFLFVGLPRDLPVPSGAGPMSGLRSRFGLTISDVRAQVHNGDLSDGPHTQAGLFQVCI